MVSCGYCKTDIARYQKLGKGNILRMHIDRIIKASIDYSGDLACSNCNKILGTKVYLKKENKEFYRMIRGRFNTRKL